MVTDVFLVIAYDISSDRRRQKIAQLLEGYGNRVNYSVFECLLTIKEAEKLNSAISGLINPRKDKVMVYTICKSCMNKILTIPQSEKRKGVVNML